MKCLFVLVLILFFGCSSSNKLDGHWILVKSSYEYSTVYMEMTINKNKLTKFDDQLGVISEIYSKVNDTLVGPVNKFYNSVNKFYLDEFDSAVFLDLNNKKWYFKKLSVNIPNLNLDSMFYVRRYVYYAKNLNYEKDSYKIKQIQEEYFDFIRNEEPIYFEDEFEINAEDYYNSKQKQ